MLPQPYAERLMATQQLGQKPNNHERAQQIDAIVAECRAQYPHLFRTAADLAVRAKEWDADRARRTKK